MNPNEQVSIINYAKYIEQIIKMAQSEEAKERIFEIINEGTLLKMPVLKNSTFFYYLKLVVDWNIFNRNIKNSLLLSVERAYQNLSYECKSDYAQLFFKLFSQDYCNYYGLDSIFMCAEKIHFIISPMYLDDVQKLFEILSKKYTGYSEYYVNFKTTIIEKIQEVVQEETDNDLNDIVSEYISSADSSEISGYISEKLNNLENNIWGKINDSIYSRIEDKLTSTSLELDIKIEDFDINEMMYYFNISGAIDAILKEDEESDKDDGYDSGVSDLTAIQSMFER